MTLIRPVLVAAVALATAACGGGDESARLSEDEFRTQANQICADLDEDLKAIDQPQSIDELGPSLLESREVFESALADLRALRPPEDLQADYDRLLATGDEALNAIDDIRQAAEDGDVAEVQRLGGEAERADEESDRIAQDLGLDACATD